MNLRSRVLSMAVPLLLAVGGVAGCTFPDSPARSAEARLSRHALQGRDVARRSGCVNCHTSDGKAGVGPTWQGIWGTTVAFVDGRTATVDDAYIRRAIREPATDQRKGFASAMPTFSLTDEEIAAVTAYIRELGTGASPATDRERQPSP